MQECAKRAVASSVNVLLLCAVLEILLTIDFTKDLKGVRYFPKILVHLHNAFMWVLPGRKDLFVVWYCCCWLCCCCLCFQIEVLIALCYSCIRQKISEFPQRQYPNSQGQLPAHSRFSSLKITAGNANSTILLKFQTLHVPNPVSFIGTFMKLKSQFPVVRSWYMELLLHEMWHARCVNDLASGLQLSEPWKL